MSLVRSFTGLDVPLAAPRPQDIAIEDIAHHLALVNRFNGATSLPYSVAQHSVYVSRMVARMGGSLREQMAGLLHDAHEAYLGDITRPLLQILPDNALAVLKLLKRDLDGMIFQRFGISHADLTATVTLADDMALLAEWRDLMTGLAPDMGKVLAAPMPVKPLHWIRAEEEFLKAYHALAIRLGPNCQPSTREADLTFGR